MNWKIAAIPTLVLLIAGGIYLFIVFEHRRNPGVNPHLKQPSNSPVTSSPSCAKTSLAL